MPLRPGEQEAADVMKGLVANEKIAMYDYMEHMSRVSTPDLKHYGHKSIEEAYVWRFKDAQKKIKKIQEEFLKKFPD